MRAFRCPRCGSAVAFEAQQCSRCAVEVGFHKPWMQLALAPADGEATRIDNDTWVRCADWVHGCNWLVEESRDGHLCFADRFVRTRPSPDDAEAMAEFSSTLTALHRLIFELLMLKLPLRNRTEHPRGLAFDLISGNSLGHPVTIGHADGVITIDLVESLELYRERLRIKLNEPYRTMLGHFRHEVGHYYEMILVGSNPLNDEAREYFGDERTDYHAALQRYYDGYLPPEWEHDYISHYATAHPWEDWAETFAHHLHIIATMGTVAESGLVLHADRVAWNITADIDPRFSYADADISTIVYDWEVLSGVLNRVNHAMGKEDLYPFTLTLPVVAKLGFVHHVISTAAQHSLVPGD